MGDLGKLIVAKPFKKSPKVQKIAKSGHTAFCQHHWPLATWNASLVNQLFGHFVLSPFSRKLSKQI